MEAKTFPCKVLYGTLVQGGKMYHPGSEIMLDASVAAHFADKKQVELPPELIAVAEPEPGPEAVVEEAVEEVAEPKSAAPKLEPRVSPSGRGKRGGRK